MLLLVTSLWPKQQRDKLNATCFSIQLSSVRCSQADHVYRVVAQMNHMMGVVLLFNRSEACIIGYSLYSLIRC